MITFRSPSQAFYCADGTKNNSALPGDPDKAASFIKAVDQIEPFVRGLLDKGQVKEAIFSLRCGDKKNHQSEFTLMSAS